MSSIKFVDSDLPRKSAVKIWKNQFNGEHLYHSYANFRVRTKPDISADVLIKLRESGLHTKPPFHEITFTGKHKGNWAEIKVNEYKGEFGCFGDTKPNKKTLLGWIKLIGDDGLPNLWFYSRGC